MYLHVVESVYNYNNILVILEPLFPITEGTKTGRIMPNANRPHTNVNP